MVTVKAQAQSRLDEINRLIVDGPNSLTQFLVKAYRAESVTEDKAEKAFAAIQSAIEDAWKTYQAAIKQPEAKVTAKSRVTL